MHCPNCYDETKVIDSRAADQNIRRRRQCINCGHRFSTKEVDSEHLAKLLTNNKEYLRLLKKHKALSDQITLETNNGTNT